MLGKIIKYDLKATARLFIPMYIGLIIMSILNKLLFEMSFATHSNSSNNLMGAISSIVMLIYIISLISIFILTTAFIVIHFYKNMTGDEAYLMLTLPVNSSTHIMSKTLVAVIWQIITIILVILSFMLLASGHGIIEAFEEITYEFSELIDNGYLSYFIIFLIQGVIAIIVSLFSTPLNFYVSIAIGQLMGKYRILGSIGIYIGLYIIIQFISTIFVAIMGLGFMNIDNVINYAQLLSLMNIYFIVILAFNIILTIVFYLVTNYIYSKKINLE